MWTRKKVQMNSRRLLRDGRGGRRNAFNARNGHHPGASPGRGKGRETGICRGVFGTGGAARGAGADGQPDGPDRRGGRPAELETVKLGSRPSWTGEAGKPAKLERRGRETGRAGAVRLKAAGRER